MTLIRRIIRRQRRVVRVRTAPVVTRRVVAPHRVAPRLRPK
jgi:hypothetical protein